MDNVYVLNKKYFIKREPIKTSATKMMFKKYMSKISNTIGTVNYLQHKAKESRRGTRHLYDDGYDVQDIDPSTINKMDIDLSVHGSRRGSVLGGLPANAQIVLSAAMANLRNTLLFYPLVFLFYFVVFFLISFFFYVADFVIISSFFFWHSMRKHVLLVFSIYLAIYNLSWILMNRLQLCFNFVIFGQVLKVRRGF